MFWKISAVDGPESFEGEAAGRFVLHRHTDSEGEHLDLRLECGDHLEGWRVADTMLADEVWATAKAPHPLHWLDEDRDAIRVDDGTYAWNEDGGELVLIGRDGTRYLHVRRSPDVSAMELLGIFQAIRESGVALGDAAELMRDGATARQRATQRLCGLGRELDGDAFEHEVWRKTLRGLTLEEIHAQLRSFEVRFDRAHPPEPVSRPENLSDDGGRAGQALAILRG